MNINELVHHVDLGYNHNTGTRSGVQHLHHSLPLCNDIVQLNLFGIYDNVLRFREVFQGEKHISKQIFVY